MFRRLAPIFMLACLLALVVACGPFGPDTPTPATSPPTPLLKGEGSATVIPSSTVAVPPTAAATATIVPADTATPVAADSATPVAAADTATPSAATAESSGTPVASVSGTPPVEASAQPTTLAQLATIEAEAATLRGLQPKRDVPEHFVSSAQIATNLKKEINDDYSPAEGRRDALELWLLRLIPDRTVDLYQIQIDLLGEQVLGYYDPKTKELFIRSDQQPLGAEAQDTLAHEFVHSLQDEYYDLQKLRPDNSHNNDRDTAVTSLIEGDATVAQVQFAQRYMSPADLATLMQGSADSSTAVLDKAPAYIRDSLIFPYDSGAQFVATLQQHGGYAAVNKALADPPVSTEQILHPEKYLTTHRDLPLAVSLPPLTSTLGSGWTIRNEDTLGEFDLAALLRYNGVTNADTAAAGWGGARFAFYQDDSDALVILSTRWDTAKDATEFETALRRSFLPGIATGDQWTDGERSYALRHSGSSLTLITATNNAAVLRALAAVK
ncbi:MAG: hypothetical protein M3Z04_12155 [Chloroflexota bacterium]|nr:hypothetical protein [Chloroflexota bacterium]